MLKFTAFVSAFYIIFIVLSGLLLPPFMRQNLIYPYDHNGHTQKMLNDISNFKNIDLLFVGSSRAYRGFDPDVYAEAGYTSFVMGTSNQTPMQTLYLLKKYYPQLTPKWIIMEVNPDIFSNDGVESTIDLISNSPPDLKLSNLVLEIKSIKAINTMIYAAMTHWFGLKKYIKSVPSHQNHSYHTAGFSKSNLLPYDTIAGNSYFCNIKIAQLKALDQIIAFAASNDTRIRFVQSPVLPRLYLSCSDNLDFDRILHAKGMYVNYNIYSNFSDTSFFSDAQHLNQNGVMRWNKMIVKDILSNDKMNQ
ncbi:MAG: hypothetical protein WAU01_13620 [Saprospiraceae bacterium]